MWERGRCGLAASRHGQLPHNVLPHLTVGLGVEVTGFYSREAGNVLLTVAGGCPLTRGQVEARVVRRARGPGGPGAGQLTRPGERGPPVGLGVAGPGAEVTREVSVEAGVG